MRQNGGFFMSTGNQEYIRDMNRALVLEAIANHPPLSRADLAKMLHLTKATVSTIVQELLDRQLVIELGSAEKTSMGRKPILLTFNNRCGSIIAVDLGVKKITILTGDLKGKSCTVKEYPIDPSLSLEEYLISLLHTTKSDLPKTPCGLVGISIGIYGVVCDDLVLFTPYYDLKHSNLKNYLEEEFQVPVIVENEANLSVIGEAACAEHFKNMIFLNIHEGVGMGILIDGELYTGQNGYAGEFGHTILFPDGRPCPCGNHGCLEQYISEAAVLNDFAAAEGLENVSVERFIQYYQEGNPNARKVMQDFTHYIGISLNTVLHTFNPDVIVINSSFTNYIPGLIDEITSGIQNRLRWYLHVLPAHLQDVSSSWAESASAPGTSSEFPPLSCWTCNSEISPCSEPHLDSAALHLDVASRHMKFQKKVLIHASMIRNLF